MTVVNDTVLKVERFQVLSSHSNVDNYGRKRYVSLARVIISLCISNYRVIHLKYIQFLFKVKLQ